MTPITPEVTVPKAVVRYKRNYGPGKSVFFVEYEYKGERYITGTVIRGTDKSLGWYFGKGTEGLKEANRIALLSDDDFSKAEDDPRYSWVKTLKALSEPAMPSTHPLVLKRYPLGEVPEKIKIGGLEVPVPPPKVVSENAAIRTDERLDKTVEHLGYQSITLSEEELASLDRAIPTDVDIVSEAQKRLKEAEVIPDSKLDTQQLAHLNLARAIASHTLLNNPVLGVYAAIIPPASDRVRTAGMYGTSTKAIYISLDILPRCRSTVDTLVHELGHHRQHTKEDLTPEHAKAMTDVAARVVADVAKGTFDELLKEVSW